MKINFGLLISAVTLISGQSFAATQVAEASTALKMQSDERNTVNSIQLSSPISNQKFEKDKDITDARIIAEAGSLSKYSLKFNISYFGPGITDLNNPMQPNPDGTNGVFETTLAASLGARYRLDPKSSLGIGSGVNALTPIQGVKKYEVKNPFINYDLTNRIGNVQLRNSFTALYVSNTYYQSLGEYAGIGYDNSIVYNLGTTPLAIGLDTSLAYYLFNREYLKKDKSTSRYSLAFYPSVKYNFSDKFNVNSSLAYSFWNPRATSDETKLVNKLLSQRIGIGYAYMRDVYFAPYLNFYPTQFNTDSTTINLSATFSLM